MCGELAEEGGYSEEDAVPGQESKSGAEDDGAGHACIS